MISEESLLHVGIVAATTAVLAATLPFNPIWIFIETTVSMNASLPGALAFFVSFLILLGIGVASVYVALYWYGRKVP